MSVKEVLTNIADVIRAFTGKTDKITLSEMPDEIDKVYQSGVSLGKDEGRQSKREEFWENYYTNRTKNFTNAFYGYGWNDVTFDPIDTIVCQYVCTSMFERTLITDTKVEISFVPINNSQTTTRVFYLAERLKTITKLSVTELVRTFNSWFYGCTKLENIEIGGTIAVDFDIHWSPLTKKSILSIYDHLSTTAILTLTFNLNAVNKAFETSEGANDGSTSDEWKTLINNKPSGVTISLLNA